MLLPPGRRVYQKGSYTLWEIDGAQQPVLPSSVDLVRDADLVAVLPKSEPFRETLHRPQSEHHHYRLGKAKADVQSVFFHVGVTECALIQWLTSQVENFLFYVLCDAATSRRDQVMAFFSKVRSHVPSFSENADETGKGVI
jgi:hypothetical protein